MDMHPSIHSFFCRKRREQLLSLLWRLFIPTMSVHVRLECKEVQLRLLSLEEASVHESYSYNHIKFSALSAQHPGSEIGRSGAPGRDATHLMLSWTTPWRSTNGSATGMTSSRAAWRVVVGTGACTRSVSRTT